MEEIVRWSVKVSKDTDVSLRSFLAQRGMKKGDLSKFIERAVQKEVFALSNRGGGPGTQRQRARRTD